MTFTPTVCKGSHWRRCTGVKLSDGQAKLRELVHLLFFSCNAGLVLDMVGQLLEMVKTDRKSPW